MDESKPDRSRRLSELAWAVRERFPSTMSVGASPIPIEPTGVATFDRMLPGGGLPRGRLSLLEGPPSSGRAALALAVAANMTARGRMVGWIDSPGTFHPPSAAAAGLDLDELLLVCPPSGDLGEALHAAVLLLRTRTLSMLVLDLTFERKREGKAPRGSRAPEEAFTRLSRAIPSSSLCLALSDPPSPPPLFRVATLTVNLERREPRWDGPARDSPLAPRTLGGLTVAATLARSRLGGEGERHELLLGRGRSLPGGERLSAPEPRDDRGPGEPR